MKRRLINFEDYKNLENTSITKLEQELIECEELLAEVLENEKVELVFFNESEVVYKNEDEDLIRANYKLEEEKVVFENIEKLVIDEETELKESKKILSSLVDNVIEGKDELANDLFNQYLNLPHLKRTLTEGYKVVLSNPKGKRSKLKGRKRSRSAVMKGVRNRLKTLRKRKGQRALISSKAAPWKKRLKSTNNPRARLYVVKTMKEWNELTENVLGYVNHKEMGTLYKECVANYNEKGDIVSVAIPTVSKKNEGKVLGCDWKVTDTEVKVLRKKAKKLMESEKFVKAVSDLNRANNISDNDVFSTVLENTVGVFPEVLYLTQDEISAVVKECLESVNARNFDDNSCNFIAEAVLRTAFEAYSDRASRIVTLAGVKLDENSEDKFVNFKEVSNNFFKYVDETESADQRVFEDLYVALENLKKIANETSDGELLADADGMMKECIEILNGEKEPDVQLAEFIANYLRDITESNLGTQEWESEEPVVSATGDHPALKEKARKSYSPANDFEGDDVDSPAPVSDGKTIKNDLDDEMRMDVFSSMADEDKTWPGLKNPYIPDSMEFTMKGEKGADKDDSGLAQDQSKDTYPELKNPFQK